MNTRSQPNEPLTGRQASPCRFTNTRIPSLNTPDDPISEPLPTQLLFPASCVVPLPFNNPGPRYGTERVKAVRFSAA
ncbi:hypothetical protein LZ31DRAFT_560550 [Colletotrichum somersetense]|nr:hypothetical protein LZ31DRAFT_560550 [Colletotrichum somersetense]